MATVSFFSGGGGGHLPRPTLSLHCSLLFYSRCAFLLTALALTILKAFDCFAGCVTCSARLAVRHGYRIIEKGTKTPKHLSMFKLNNDLQKDSVDPAGDNEQGLGFDRVGSYA